MTDEKEKKTEQKTYKKVDKKPDKDAGLFYIGSDNGFDTGNKHYYVVAIYDVLPV